MTQIHQIGFEGRSEVFECADQMNILAAARAAQVRLPFGCLNGQCGACRIRCLSGQIDEKTNQTLTQAERDAGYVLLCQAEARSDVILLSPPGLPALGAPDVRQLPARIERKQRLCEDVMAIWLKVPSRDEFTWLAGQYIDILLPQGERRSFSIANQPESGALIELHLRLVSGGIFTQQIFAAMPEKTLLRLEGPLGGFFLRAGDKPLLFMGGGTGFAPLQAMLQAMQAAQDLRTVHLYWGAQKLEDLYAHEYLENLQKNWANFTYTPVLAPDFVHEKLAQNYPNLSQYEVYMSGPPAMIQAARTVFQNQCQLPINQLFYDSFDYAWQTWGKAKV